MPRKPVNLDGQRFGSLTVEYTTDQRNSYGRLLYLCRCDCGNTRLATAQNLKRGEITRCKTCQGRLRMKDLKGQRFGKLTAIQPTDAPTAKCTTYKWLCVCDCGNVVTASVNALTTGKTKSCGCAHNIKSLYVDGTAPCKLSENEHPRKTNTSGRTGVWFDQRKQLWCAELVFRKKKYFLGRFASFDDAVKAREKAEKKYFRKFLKKHSKKHETKNSTDTKLHPLITKTCGGLKVLALIEKRPRMESRFLCECTHCGKFINRSESTIRKPAESCGCLRKHNPMDGSRTITKVCPICEKPFQSLESQNKKFCSRKCFTKYRSENKQNNAKLWRFVSPDGTIYECQDLKKWARENYRLIDPDTGNVERTATNFANGMSIVKRSLRFPNGNFKAKAYQYKGWKLLNQPEELGEKKF